MSITEILHLLACPSCRSDLHATDDELVCDGKDRHKFPIVNGIPRFVNTTDGPGYSDHWDQYAQEDAPDIKQQQAKQFVDWLVDGSPPADSNSPTVYLDIGCGDGNHLPHLPADGIKIALDYSSAIDVVAQRHQRVKNCYLLQADAQALPIRDGVIDHALSYSCLNCLPDVGRGTSEAARVIRIGGSFATWGFGTDSAFVYRGFRLARNIYQLLPGNFLKRLVVYLLLPSLLFVRNSTSMNPIKNSFSDCAEIVSTNLVPPHLKIFFRNDWRDLSPDCLEYIDDYEIPCGQRFVKK